MRSCHWCGGSFFICRRCDRGHAYCGERCRRQGYARSRRRARQRHQGSPEGKADHREAMRELRARRKAAVTDQPSEEGVAESKVAVEEATDARTEGEVLHPRAEQRCIVCGTTRRWSRWYPCWWGRRRR
jgi:hypothetical protein